MNSFGLGLVLNFVDNASAGMNSATRTFTQMSMTADSMTSSVSTSATEMTAIAYSLNAVGDTFINIGSSITGVFSNITQQVIDSGMAMQGYRMQMRALYGDKLAEEKIQEIAHYAKTSVFEIQSLIPAVTMMKAVGIEAMQEVTTSSGSATQILLDYASDIAAMVPNMHNVYGTGVAAAMGAMKEYIAEGNAMSLKRGAGLDITGILGEDKGATMEERTQQIADLVEKLNILGYTEKLQNTPTQRLSNLQDVLFQTLTKIADSGVFEVYCGLLEKLSDWLFDISKNEETFNAITGVLADTISTILSPLQSMLDWVIANSDAIIEWVKQNPKLVKNILLTVAAIGAFLVVGGSLLKLLSSIAFAMSGLSVIKSLPLLLGKSVIAMLPFIAVAGLAYTAWSSNLGGIQDKITWFFNNVGDIFSILGDAWSDNTLSEENFVKATQLGILPFIQGILQLKYYWDFFVQGFKTGFVAFFQGLTNVLGNLGIDLGALAEKFIDFLARLTQPNAEDEWVKLGEIMGGLVATMATLALIVKILTPVIKLVTYLYKGFSWLVKVFKNTGIAGKSVIAFFGSLIAVISNVAKGYPFLDALTIYFPKLASVVKGFITVVTNAWSWIAANIVTIGGWALGIVGALLQIFGTVDAWINGMDWSNFGLQVGGLGAAILGFFILFQSTGAAIAAIIGGIILLVTSIRDWLENGTSWENVLGVVIGIAAIGGAISLLAVSWIPIAVAGVIALIMLVVMWWNKIAGFFVWLGQTVANFFVNAWNAVASFFVNLWNTVVSTINNIFNKIREVITNIVQAILSNPFVQAVIKIMTSIFNCVVTVVKTIITFIVGVATTIWNIIKLIGTVVAGVARTIWAVISGVVSVIWTIIKGIANFIVAVAMGIWNVIKAVANFIWTAVKVAANIIKSIVNVVYQLFRVIFLAILAVAKIVINAIVSVFSWLWEKIQPVLQAIGDFFALIFNWVKTNVIDPVVSWIVTAFTAVRDWIMGVLQSIGDFFSSIFNWINENVLTPFLEFITSIFDWINEKVTVVTDWIAEAFDTAVQAIKDTFEGIGDFFSGIFESITEAATSFFDWIGEKLGWLTDGLSSIGEWFGGVIDGAGDWLSGIGDSLADFVGLDTGGYVKTTGLAVLHPNEVVVNDDTTKRLQNFLGKYEDDTVNGISRNSAPTQAVLNNIYPTVMEAVPVAPIPAETVSKVDSSSVITNNTQTIIQPTQTGTSDKVEYHNDYSVTFATGSVVIQLSGTSDADLEKAAEKLMKIIARKQQLRAMAVRK